MSAQVDVWIVYGSKVIAGPLSRPVRLTPDKHAGVVVEGRVYPLPEDHRVDVSRTGWSKDECLAFLAHDALIPYAPAPTSFALRQEGTGPEDDAPMPSHEAGNGAFPQSAAVRWVDICPWIPTVSSPRSVAWWTAAIDQDDAPRLRLRATTVAEMAIENLPAWAIGQVLPHLRPEINLGELEIPTRGMNVLVRLARHSDVRAEDILAVRLGDLLQTRNVGITTATAILRELVVASFRPPEVASNGSRPTNLGREGSSAPHTEGSDPISQMLADATEVAAWLAAIGLPSAPLVAGQLPPGAPTSVISARHRLEAVTADDLLEEDEARFDLAEMLNDALLRLDDRQRSILGRRLFAEAKDTLDEIGRDLGVTRERVRQLEAKSREAMLELAGSIPQLAVVRAALPELIGELAPLPSLVQTMPALKRRVRCVAQPAWFVLDRLDDLYEIEDNWCASPSIREAKERTRIQLEGLADQYGVVELIDVDLLDVADHDSNRAYTEEWLDYCGYVVDDAFVLTRTGNIEDYAAAILSTAGAPMTTSQIQARMVEPRAASSIRNQLSDSEDVVRVDRDTWALAEWGFDEYGGIRTVMRDAVEQAGGKMRLQDLISSLTSRFTVSPQSIATYAAAPPFDLVAGVVSISADDYQPHKTIDRTRRVFRRGDSWLYRVRITGEHMRGSGFPCPVALAATELGMQPGDSIELASRLGPQAVSWVGAQPVCGSIRRFLLDGGIEVDTQGFLVFGADLTFDFEPVREDIRDPLARALALVGAPVSLTEQDVERWLARALDLPSSASMPVIIRTLHERGDTDAALLLAEARAEEPATP